VELVVPISDLAFYSTINGKWEVARGEHTVRVGPSADPEQLKLSHNFMIE
jgi:hypothetical protein